MCGLPTVMPHRPGMETNASFVSPTCCATPNTPSMPATPVSHRASTSFCGAPRGIGQRRPGLKDSTLAQYRADLDRRLDRLLAVSPTTEPGQQLARGIRKCRGDLFVFVTRRAVPATNNDCERALRPSVIF